MVKLWSKIDIERKKKTPVYLHHGSDDPIVPKEFAHGSYSVLSENGLDHVELAIEKGVK